MESIKWDDYLVYDESSPTCLRWKVDVGSGRFHKIYKVRKGDVAGATIDTSGYYQVKLNRKTYRVHRIIYEMYHGTLGRRQVDHFDGNRLNNKVSNLRSVDHVVNTRNKKKRRTNMSGVTGVSIRLMGSNTYCAARWVSIDGCDKAKLFSVRKYGLLPAFSLACEYRNLMIKELNENGAGYTERHGE